MPLPTEIPISKYFHGDRILMIDKYVEENLGMLIRGLRTIREDKITSWRRVYSATPREKSRSFPWQNASNLVIGLVGSFVDQLTAKLIMGTIGIEPIWTARLCGEWKRREMAEKQREAIEEWLWYSGLEPAYLNILSKYVIWARTGVKYGFGAIKLMPERQIEQVVAASVGRTVTFNTRVKHQGAVAMPLLFEDFLMPPTTVELERSRFIAQRARLYRMDMKALLFDDSYDKVAVRECLQNPTREGPDKTEQEVEMDTGVKSDYGDKLSSVWDIYQCWFPYTVNGDTFQIIYEYDYYNRKPLKRVFNWLPENSLPYIGFRLGSDGERAYGLGFCEMLKDYQEEVSTIHNQRRDNSTLANTNILRVSPGLQADSNFSIYPNALFPGEEKSVEVIPLGRTGMETIKDEQLVLSEAADRAGVGPSSSGSGSGTVNRKGAYSAMGTMSTMQEGNTRANLNITEFRMAHYMFGGLSLTYDAHFGVPEKVIEAFGEKGKYLRMGLDNYRDGRIILPIRAATGSVNKEIEKQNLMLYLNNLRAHWQMVNQLIQATSNPMAPPALTQYLLEVILAGNWVMKKIGREYGVDDASAAVPDVPGVEDRLKQMEAQQLQQKIMQAMQQMKQQGGGQQQGGGEQPGQQQPPGLPPQGGTGQPQPNPLSAPETDRMPTQ